MTTEQATRTGHALSSIKTAIKKEHKSHSRLPISRDPAKNALATMLRKANEHSARASRTLGLILIPIKGDGYH